MAISEDGKRFDRFCRNYLVHSLGDCAGQPFILEPWELEFASEALRRDGEKRVYKQALLGIARGNGKSTLSSALALYGLVVEGALFEQGARVYALAGSMAQARIVFDEAKRMVESSPLLRDWVKPYRDTLVVPSTGATFTVLPAGYPEKLHGLNPSLFIADELHAWKDPELWHAMTTAQIKRQNSLGIAITTAGFDLNTICGELYERGKAGDEKLYFKWYEVPKDRVDDPAAWKLANPASFVTQEALEEQAKSIPLGVFRRLHLNVWTRTEDLWLPAGAWEKNLSDLTIDEGDDVWIGVDLGVKNDTAAVVEVARKEGKYVVRAHVFGAHADPSKPAPTAHTIIEGDRIYHGTVENCIREISQRQSVQEITFDPWRFERSAQLLEEQGFLCVEFPMSNARMAPASVGLFDSIVNGEIAHDGDEVLATHIGSTAPKATERGYRITKANAKYPMDASMALCIALERAKASESSGFAFYASTEAEDD